MGSGLPDVTQVTVRQFLTTNNDNGAGTHFSVCSLLSPSPLGTAA